MSLKKQLAIFFAAAAISVTAWWIHGNQIVATSSEVAPGSTQTAGMSGQASPRGSEAAVVQAPEKPKVIDAKDPVRSILTSDDLNSAFVAAVAFRGPKDPQVRSLYSQTREICETELAGLRVPSASALSDDKMRAWAVDQLASRCKAFDSSVVNVDKEPVPSFYDKMNMSDEKTAVTEALAAVHTSQNAVDLVGASELLLSTDHFPYNEVFGKNPGLSYEQVSNGVRNAALLTECDALGGCGPKSLTTVAFCAKYGCQQGIGFDMALRNAISPNEYATTMAIYSWFHR